VYSDAHHCIFIAGRCILTYSNQPPDAKYFTAFATAAARVSEQHAGRLAVITIIDSATPIPDESTRKLIQTTMQRYASAIERFAYVVEGRGFAAAAIRSVISVLGLAARTPYRQKVFASVEEAEVWLAHAPPQPGSAPATSRLSPLARTMRDKVAVLARAS
jgi:hypothetical protein